MASSRSMPISGLSTEIDFMRSIVTTNLSIEGNLKFSKARKKAVKRPQNRPELVKWQFYRS